MEQPSFKYHPDLARSNVVTPSKAACPRCGQDRRVSYVGPFYALEEVTDLCLVCIADGTAAQQWQLTFVDPAGPEPLDEPSKLDELLHRTPGYFSAQGDPWPVHCHDYCALIGLVEWPTLAPLERELGADLMRLERDLELSREELIAELSREASPLWAHLFQCLSCPQHRLVADYE